MLMKQARQGWQTTRRRGAHKKSSLVSRPISVGILPVNLFTPNDLGGRRFGQ